MPGLARLVIDMVTHFNNMGTHVIEVGDHVNDKPGKARHLPSIEQTGLRTESRPFHLGPPNMY